MESREQLAASQGRWLVSGTGGQGQGLVERRQLRSQEQKGKGERVDDVMLG